MPCLALIALDTPCLEAQTLTSDLFRPGRDGFLTPQDSPLRKISADSLGEGASD